MKPDLATIEMDALMAEWREHVVAETGHFVGDGIVCKDGWSAAYPKVLFILKEPNGYEGQHGPLNELLRRAAAPNSTSATTRRCSPCSPRATTAARVSAPPICTAMRSGAPCGAVGAAN